MADIDRDGVATLIEEEYSGALLDFAGAASSALTAFRRVNLGTKVTNLPVLTTLPEAEWVGESATADDGKKPTSKAIWGNKQIVVEEVAVIVPIHENVLDDANENLLGDLTGLGGQAIGKKLDQAVFFGQDKPTTWTSPDLLAAATAAGNLFTPSASAGVNDLFGSIAQAAEAVDDSGADPNAIISRSGLRFQLMNLRASDGSAVYQRTLADNGAVTENILGLDATFNRNGAWDRTLATAFVADASRVIIGVRQDVTVKFLDQATVGGINLAERDMVALRFKARFGYVLGNTIASDGQTTTPVAAVVPSNAS
jgi:HK97 family phage major capsid protein